MEYGSESGGLWYMALRVDVSVIFALRVEVCGIWFSKSGGVWNMALRVEVCGIWL